MVRVVWCLPGVRGVVLERSGWVIIEGLAGGVLQWVGGVREMGISRGLESKWG